MISGRWHKVLSKTKGALVEDLAVAIDDFIDLLVGENWKFGY